MFHAWLHTIFQQSDDHVAATSKETSNDILIVLINELLKFW